MNSSVSVTNSAAIGSIVSEAELSTVHQNLEQLLNRQKLAGPENPLLEEAIKEGLRGLALIRQSPRYVVFSKS